MSDCDSEITTDYYDINEVDKKDRCCNRCKNYKPYTEFIRQQKKTFNKYCLKCRKYKQNTFKINNNKEEYILNYMNANEDKAKMIEENIKYMKDKLTNIFKINNQDKRKKIIEEIIIKLIKSKKYNDYDMIYNISFIDNKLNDLFETKPLNSYTNSVIQFL